MAFVVDNSWSIQVDATLEKTKGVILELLKDARHHHDKVALVTFRHNRRPDATVCLPLTRSYALAAERLRSIRVSGTTPLPDGLLKAGRLLRQERIKYHNAIPVMVVVTDGLANVPLVPGGDPYADMAGLCRRQARDGVKTIIVDTEPGGSEPGRGHCREMASWSKGACLPLSGLTLESVRGVLSGGATAPLFH